VRLVTIDSLDDPRVADYRNLRDHELLQRADPFDPEGHRGLFIAEGELVVRRLLESTYRARSLFIAPNRVETLRDVIEPLPDDIPVYVADPGVLNEIVGFNIHRGILGAGIRPRPPRLEELLGRGGPFVVLEDLYNHDNIGSIFRNAAALGGVGVTVLLSPGTADPLYRKALRVSTGHALLIPWTRLENWPGDLDRLREAGIELLAMTPGPGSRDIRDVAAGAGGRAAGLRGERVAKRCAILMGTEGTGLTETAMAKTDARVRIDMPIGPSGAPADSLNVAVASAIALFALAPAPAPGHAK
jgi:tRNA G18 (ribose-2'-O)-methylase SpoU